MKTIQQLFIATLAASALLLTGCGQGSSSSNSESAAADDGIRSIRITGNDSMKYNIGEIEASPGEELRINFHNIGRMPKQTMGHNWVLFKKMSEAELNKLAMEASQNPPDHLPKDRSAILAYTAILGPGQSESITFKAPTEPGEYPFACTFPGHFALMRGKLIVK